MSADSSWDVQKAVYELLTVDPALTELLAAGEASVFDHVPQASGFPYVVLGEMKSRPFATQATSGNDVTLTLHIYSRNTGMKEAREIMKVLRGLLDGAALDITGHTCVLCRWIESGSVLEQDGRTRHGTQHYQVITEPEEE